jgi:transcriptional regulator with XRE-family HTH domain
MEMSRIGARIREERENRALTIAQLATALGIAPSAVWTIETGRRLPRLSTLAKMAAYFDIPVAELVALRRQDELERGKPGQGNDEG